VKTCVDEFAVQTDEFYRAAWDNADQISR
jgi:hypothetical protein